MQRLILYAAMVASCALTAVVDVAFATWTGYDPIHFSVWIIVPIGALLCGMAASGGGIGIAYLLHIRPTRTDALAMVAMGVACMASILFLNYWTYALPDGRKAHDLVDFWRFMDVTTRSAHMRIGRAMTDTGEVGTFGYYQLGFELIAFLAGGLAAYGTILQMPACEACPSYLRKVRETSNGDLPVDQADRLLGLMKGGLEDVQNVVTWRPEKHPFEKREKRAKLACRLYECPRCKLEVVTASAMVYDGKAWKQVRPRPSEGTSARGRPCSQLSSRESADRRKILAALVVSRYLVIVGHFVFTVSFPPHMFRLCAPGLEPIADEIPRRNTCPCPFA